MPCFNWLGLNKEGLLVKGQSFCSSEGDVVQRLKTNKIDVISVEKDKSWINFKKIKLKDKVEFFAQLSQLLNSGIMLPKALSILERTNNKIYATISFLHLEVQEGASFVEAMQKMPDLFEDLEIYLAMAGQESGNLAGSLKYIAEFLEVRQKFTNKLNSLLLVPVITIIIFIMISLAIFFYVIPSFASIFKDNNIQQDSFVFALSSFFNKIGFLNLFLFIICFLLACSILLRTLAGKRLKSFLAINVPFLKKISLYINLTYFLESLAFMLKAGVHLSNALEIAQNSVTNYYLKAKFSKLAVIVKSGQSLEAALNSLGIIPLDILAMVSVGQETGRLSDMLTSCASIYLERSLRLIGAFLGAFQPTLMLLLGFLVMMLIFSVYLPIFDLASGIQV